MRIGLGQFNATVGDLAGNAEKMRNVYAQALKSGVDLLTFPEMAVCGYPPEDLLLKKHFIEDTRAVVEKLAADCPDTTMIVVFAEYNQGPPPRLASGDAGAGKMYNSAGVLRKGRIEKIYRKGLLPNYGVFDERRYFEPGTEPLIIKLKGLNIAVTICEDLWGLNWLGSRLGGIGSIQLIVNISASPFHTGKITERQELLSRCAKKFNCPVAYCNLVGGQDELIFDGRSMFTNSKGIIVAQAKAFGKDRRLPITNRYSSEN